MTEMTLAEAIAEVKLRSVGGVYWPGAHGDANVAEAILNAVASDQLIPVQCCMCGKSGLSVVEDGGPECELSDGRWVCSSECWDLAVDPIPRTDAELAVALAYRLAADEIRGSNLGLTVSDVADDVLALAPAEPLAEVQALKAERDEWKRLYWMTRSFAVHDDDCTINRHPHYRDCSCGLRAALTTPEKGTE